MIRKNGDPKVQAILESAWTAFSSYGFRKTSMDDIARGAGMSRPALYLHFRNKEAIFCALTAAYYEEAQAGVSEALNGSGALAEKLRAAFTAQGGPVMEAMMSSQHGMELFEAGLSVASDVISEGEAAMQGLYATWLEQEAAAGRVVLPVAAEQAGRTICAALKGLKHTSQSFQDYSEGVMHLAAVMSRALEPR